MSVSFLLFLRRHPAFARVFWADAAAQIGQNMLVVALPTLILEMTGDVTLTGLAFTAEIIAYGLLSPWAGWLADRCPQKPLMHLANALRACLLLLMLGTLHRGSPFALYLLLSLALGAAGALFSPARAAFLRRLLEGAELEHAVALEGTSMFLLRMISPALMGGLLLISDARAGMMVDLTCYLISSALLAPAWVNGALAPRPVASAPDGDWRAGWRFLRSSPNLLALLWIDVGISVLGMASWSTAVAYLEQVLHVRAANNGWLQASMGLTGALGTRLAARFNRALDLRAPLLVLICCSYMCLPYAHSLPLLVAIWSLRGLAVGAMVVLIAQNTAREVPAALMGRVQAAWEQAALLACFVGSAATPLLLRWGGPRQAFQIYAVLSLGGLLLAGLVRFLRVRGAEPPR